MTALRWTAFSPRFETEKRTVEWQTANSQYVPGIVKWLQREPWRNYVDATATPQGSDNEEQWESW